MEHNFTFASVEEMNATHDILEFFLGNQGKLRQLVGVTTLENFPYVEHYPANLTDLLDRLAHDTVAALEAEKPSYEHRYSILDSGGEMIVEEDTLNDAWRAYKHWYEEGYSVDYCADDGDYSIYDNKLQKTVTNRVPCFEVEFEWSANLEVTYHGRSVDDYERPDWVSEEIYDAFANGDDYGTCSYDIGGIDWSDIADWESENEEVNEEPVVNEPNEVNEGVNAEISLDDNNTWHIY